MDDNHLDQQIIAAIKGGSSTREKLTAIELLRLRSWTVICMRLASSRSAARSCRAVVGWRIL